MMLYIIADTYGVFFNDWWTGINKSRKSRKLYGGLNNNDFLLLKEMKDRNKLIIMEYNSFDFPTAQFESVRTQEKLGIVFSGWSGKYFSSLDTTSKISRFGWHQCTENNTRTHGNSQNQVL